jgi:hypothetical protein
MPVRSVIQLAPGNTRTFLQIKRRFGVTGQSSINAIVKKINKSKALLIKPDLLEISQWRSD